MNIIIFENVFSREELDDYIIKMKQEHPDFDITKIIITDKEKMQEHQDVITLLRRDGLDILPIVKIDGKITKIEKDDSKNKLI